MKLSELIWELKDRNIEHTIEWEIIKKSQTIYTRKKRVQTLFGRKISNFNQSSLPKQKRGYFLSLRAQKTFPAVKRKHKPTTITHSHLKRAARARNSGVMANQDLNWVINLLLSLYTHIYIYIFTNSPYRNNLPSLHLGLLLTKTQEMNLSKSCSNLVIL